MSIPVEAYFKCPFCKTRVDAFKQECETCSEDVSLLSSLHLLPYSLFNQGIEKFNQNDPWGALVKFCAAVEIDKKSIEFQQALYKLAKQLGLDELAVQYEQKDA